jgi:hypothetical protein
MRVFKELSGIRFKMASKECACVPIYYLRCSSRERFDKSEEQNFVITNFSKRNEKRIQCLSTTRRLSDWSSVFSGLIGDPWQNRIPVTVRVSLRICTGVGGEGHFHGEECLGCDRNPKPMQVFCYHFQSETKNEFMFVY